MRWLVGFLLPLYLQSRPCVAAPGDEKWTYQAGTQGRDVFKAVALLPDGSGIVVAGSSTGYWVLPGSGSEADEAPSEPSSEAPSGAPGSEPWAPGEPAPAPGGPSPVPSPVPQPGTGTEASPESEPNPLPENPSQPAPAPPPARWYPGRWKSRRRGRITTAAYTSTVATTKAVPDKDFAGVALDFEGNELWRWQMEGINYDQIETGVTLGDGSGVVFAGWRGMSDELMSTLAAVALNSAGQQLWTWEDQSLLHGIFYGAAQMPGGEAVVLGGLVEKDGNSDFLAVALSNSGEELWRWSDGTEDWESFNAATMLPGGAGVLLVGDTYGNFHGESAGGSDFVAVALDTQGTELWRWQSGSAARDVLSTATVLPNNAGIVVAGMTMGQWDDVAAIQSDYFAIALMPDGSELWRWHGRSGGAEEITASQPLPDGSGVALIGSIYANWDGRQTGESTLDYAVTALSNSGQELWRLQAGDAGMNAAFAAQMKPVAEGTEEEPVMVIVGGNGDNFEALALEIPTGVTAPDESVPKVPPDQMGASVQRSVATIANGEDFFGFGNNEQGAFSAAISALTGLDNSIINTRRSAPTLPPSLVGRRLEQNRNRPAGYYIRGSQMAAEIDEAGKVRQHPNGRSLQDAEVADTAVKIKYTIRAASQEMISLGAERLRVSSSNGEMLAEYNTQAALAGVPPEENTVKYFATAASEEEVLAVIKPKEDEDISPLITGSLVGGFVVIFILVSVIRYYRKVNQKARAVAPSSLASSSPNSVGLKSFESANGTAAGQANG
ncbi:unnamed protein product [Chrysoparadoxa australica]